jgi:hypothetical protein
MSNFTEKPASFGKESPKKRKRVHAQWAQWKRPDDLLLKAALEGTKASGNPKIEADTPTDYIIIAHGMTDTDELLDLNFFQVPISVLFYCFNGNKTCMTPEFIEDICQLELPPAEEITENKHSKAAGSYSSDIYNMRFCSDSDFPSDIFVCQDKKKISILKDLNIKIPECDDWTEEKSIPLTNILPRMLIYHYDICKNRNNMNVHLFTCREIKNQSSEFVPLLHTESQVIPDELLKQLSKELGRECYIQQIPVKYKNDINDVVPELVQSLSEGGTTKKITKKNKARSINKRKRRTHKNKRKYSMKKYKQNTKNKTQNPFLT